jgi:hypothetical protein
MEFLALQFQRARSLSQVIRLILHRRERSSHSIHGCAQETHRETGLEEFIRSKVKHGIKLGLGFYSPKIMKFSPQGTILPAEENHFV